MEIEMVVWSDNDNIEQVANIIHDEGYRTAEIRKESLGAYEDKCNWSWCKLNMIDSFCVDINSAMGKTVDIDDVAEQPMYRHVVYIIVGHDDDDNTKDTAEQTEKEQEENKMKHNEKINAVLNIGMVTRNGMPIHIETAEKIIGLTTDCTITRCTGFYKGHKEPSLKVEIYNVPCDKAIDLAHEFARDFNQECTACTVRFKTVFVGAMATLKERKEMTAKLENQ